MSLTGFRLILLIALFIGACLFITAQQTGVIDVTAQQPAGVGTPVASSASLAPAALKSVDQKAPAKVEPLVVDPVPQARTNVPLDGNLSGGKGNAGVVKGADRNDFVGVAVNEKNGGARSDVAAKPAGLDQHPGKADNGGSRTQTAQANVKPHHRPLAEPDQSKGAVVQAKRRKLAVKEGIKKRRRSLHAAPALSRVARRKLKPLAAPKWVSPTDFWRVW